MLKVHQLSHPITRREEGGGRGGASQCISSRDFPPAQAVLRSPGKASGTQRGRPPAEAAPTLHFSLCVVGVGGANRCFDLSLLRFFSFFLLTQSAHTRHPSRSHVALKGLSA